MVRLAEAYADLSGTPFRSYACSPCMHMNWSGLLEGSRSSTLAGCKLCGELVYKDEMSDYGYCHNCTKEVESL
jgi:hypothetical protein